MIPPIITTLPTKIPIMTRVDRPEEVSGFFLGGFFPDGFFPDGFFPDGFFPDGLSGGEGPDGLSGGDVDTGVHSVQLIGAHVPLHNANSMVISFPTNSLFGV